MRKFILPGLALAALTFGVFSVVRTQPTRESTVPPSPPPEHAFRRGVAAVGLVESSTENISVGSPLADVVAEVSVVVGQTVKAGDPLFRLDDRAWSAELGSRQAEVHVAESQVQVEVARLADATRQLSFMERIRDSRAVSEEEFARRRSAVDTGKARLEEARARVAGAKAQVRVAQTNLDRSVVRAPIDGQVLQMKTHPGEYAPAGVTATPLVLLGRLKPLYIRVDVDEHEAWRVRPEARATAVVRGNSGRKMDLAFVRFEPFVVPKKSLTGDGTERVDTRVLQILYRIEGDGIQLFVGQQMDVFIEAVGDEHGTQ